MTKKTYKILEKPSGLGEIRRNGEHLANVFYSLQVRQEFIVSETFSEKQEIPGILTISGEITVDQSERMNPVVLNLIGSGEPFTLFLSDHRQIELLIFQSDMLNGIYQVKPYGSQGLISR